MQRERKAAPKEIEVRSLRTQMYAQLLRSPYMRLYRSNHGCGGTQYRAAGNYSDKSADKCPSTPDDALVSQASTFLIRYKQIDARVKEDAGGRCVIDSD